MCAYYILLCEKVATKIERGLAPRPRQPHSNNQINVLEGSLWIVQPEDLAEHKSSADLRSVEFDGVVLQKFPLKSEEISRLSKEHFDLLFAVPTCKDRFSVYQDKTWLAEATQLHQNSIVYLINLAGFTETKITGKVRYRGPLSGHNGTWFGVELSAELRGKGTTDGFFKRKRYFTCHMDSAVFQPISKLAYCPNPDEYKEGPLYYVKPGAIYDANTLRPFPPLTLGEKVVWISDSGIEKAIVKWIGILPDAVEPIEWMIGVEFDSAVGTGTGKYKDQQLFRTKQGHASLIPVMGLLKESEYLGMFSPTHSLPSPTHTMTSDTRTSPTLTPPEQLSIPREETQHTPNEKYEPIDNDPSHSLSSALPRKPASSSFTSNTTEFDHIDTPMRDADQYWGTNNNSTAMANAKAALLAQTVDATQDHLNRFNELSSGFATIHSSQPSQQRPSQPQTIHASTGNRPVHSKYKQQDRYPRAIGTDFISLPPNRPAKNLKEQDTMSIYDQHPYENIQRGPEDVDPGSNNIYDDYDFASDSRSQFDEVDDWERIGRSGLNGELNGQPKYNSSVDVRTHQQPRVAQGRFGAGSVDGLDTRDYALLPISGSDDGGGIVYDKKDNVRPQTISNAAKRRANYTHSNTDPSVFSPPHGTPSHKPHGTTHEEDYFPPPVYPDGIRTEPRPPQHVTNIGGLNYRSINIKSSKAKSVDNIVKGVEHEPCPLHTANSVFYRPIARNDEILDEAYRNLLPEECQSHVTTPSSYVTAHEQLNQSQGSSMVSSGRPHQRSASHDTLDSGYSHYAVPDECLNRSEIPAEPRIPLEEKSDPVYARPDKVKKESYGQHDGSLRSGTTSSTIGRGVEMFPVSLTPQEANTDLDIGSTVEVVGNPESSRYGVVRWIGYFGDKNKPLVGLEMEIPNNSCTNGSFGKSQPFVCAAKKGFYVYLNKVRKDSRFEESQDFLDRSLSQAFGSLECHDIPGDVLPPSQVNNVAAAYTGRNRGIQGHHNSCYMDATLFSMFAFSTAFDHLLKPNPGSLATKDKVQLVLRQGIVNPLRRSFFVRADKVMNLRVVLDEFSKVQGLTYAEKDPEEFLNSLLQDTLKADPFIKLSSGLHSYLYQMIMEKDDQIILPSTQQLLGLSFLQANLKLIQIPEVLILQMPRCGKKYKMYPRIIPSLSLDITDILMEVPRECAICSNLASFECKECFKHFGDGSLLEISFCQECLTRCHSNPRRAFHNPVPLNVSNDVYDMFNIESKSDAPTQIPRVRLELSAVVCIDTSHYVAFVRAGHDEDSAWLFFDSMADRVGEQHGYNVPHVKFCRELPDWLRDNSRERILACKDDRDLPENVKRVLCDGYICMYERKVYR